LTAKIKKDQDEDKSLSNESSNVAKKIGFSHLKSKFHFFHLH